jgi:elongation factor 1-alpha
MDLVGYCEDAFKKFSKEVQTVLLSLGYTDIPIIPVSAFQGDNMSKKSENMKWYEGKTVIETLDDVVKPPEPLREKPLRCVVQDVYDLEGKNVAICRVETGTLMVDQSILVLPVSEEGKVNKIESFGAEVKGAAPGDSVGVLLQGVQELKRGYVLASLEKKLKPVNEFTAQIIVFADIVLTVGDKVAIRIGTTESQCIVKSMLEKIDPVKLTVEVDKPESIGNGDVGKVMFGSLDPLYLEEYSEFPQLGRFVILGKKGAAAAGIVLEKH